MVAAAVVAAGVVGAGATALSSGAAAGAQSDAAKAASATQSAMFAQTNNNLQPFRQAGADATSYLWDTAMGTAANPNGGVGSLLAPFQPTQDFLEQTPGYQFNLSQGEKAVTNSAAARGLGVSGAAMRGAADYASGLASNTYQQQYNNYNTTNDEIYNRLLGLGTLGENAAAQTGAAATQTGASIGSNLIGAGNAQAAADMATANGISGGAGNVSNLLVLQSLLGKNGAPSSAGIFGPSMNG